MNEKKLEQWYLEAVRRIMEGTPVPNLWAIRALYNEALYRKCSEEGKPSYGYSAFSNPLLALFVDAENRVLMGEDPDAAYKIFENPVKGRRIFRQLISSSLDYR